MGRPQSVTVIHIVFLVGALVSHCALSTRELDTKAELDESVSIIKVGPPTQADNMEYLMQTLSKFKSFAEKSQAGVKERHQAEAKRLQASLQQTDDQAVQLALQQSVTSNAKSLIETSGVYNNMVNFAGSMQQFLEQATSRGSACERTECGTHSSCTDTTLGAQCVCNEGYIGQGKNCRAPAEFMPHLLLMQGANTQKTQARDLHVTIFGKNNIAVVFSDVSRGGIGRSVIGNVGDAGMATLSPPVSFTEGETQAFSPMVVGTEGRRLVIAWRDQKTNGQGWLRSAALGTTQIRGAEQHLQWGEPISFAQEQSHKMASLPLPGNRVVVFFADKVKATQHTPAESFGNSMLLEVGENGALTSLGKSRFTDAPVCRLEVTKLSPKTFVIAGRAGPAIDEMDSSVHTNQEAMALFGEMSGNDLVYDPNPVNLEPHAKNIWARGVSLIAPNTFAYAYQHGDDQNMMMAVVHVNETTHRMEVVRKPSVMKAGFSPYVSMLSVPYSAADPHTLTYYNGPQNSMLNVCSWDSAKMELNKCEDFSWLQGKVESVSGVHLGGGKSLMVFAPESGTPYYGVFGLSKK